MRHIVSVETYDGRWIWKVGKRCHLYPSVVESIIEDFWYPNGDDWPPIPMIYIHFTDGYIQSMDNRNVLVLTAPSEDPCLAIVDSAVKT